MLAKISTRTLLANIEGLIDQIFNRSKVIPIDYIYSTLEQGASKIPDAACFVRTAKLFQTSDEVRPDFRFLLLPYLSFQIIDGTLSRFPEAHARGGAPTD
jgi:hypothetical protein